MKAVSQTTMFLLAALLAAYTPQASAILTIEITQGVDGGLPIAVVPFGPSQPAMQPRACQANHCVS